MGLSEVGSLARNKAANKRQLLYNLIIMPIRFLNHLDMLLLLQKCLCTLLITDNTMGKFKIEKQLN